MGAYLSKPVTEKEIESGEDEFLSYVSGSMQGWRTSQEDAHNCVLNYNDEYSLFAVYDGHGGAEVAQFCSQKLPDYIKNNTDFLEGNYSDALINSFLSFDDELLTTEAQETLKKLANIDEVKSDDEDEDDNLLLQEALTPLSEILKKYQLPLKNLSDDESENNEESEINISLENPKEITKKAEYFSTSDLMSCEKSTKKIREISEDLSEDEDDDEEFVIEDEEENEENEEDNDDDDDDDEDDEDENDECEKNSCFPPFQYLQSSPGYDSGSTAVLTLVNRKTLKVYVANIGDSRCVLCRNGVAIDLSIDHKPEDEIESARIAKAGGILSEDGRVNGGLNLSRSFGDHSYKKNKDIPMKDQMISAFPDIQTIDLKPHEDEFLVLACDGIWNSFTSQLLVDFIKKRINSMPMTDIISTIFTDCLAPDTSGDGTGCDNMTCIIIQLKFPPQPSICNGRSNRKRTAAKDLDEESVHSSKTAKSHNEESVKI